jgi:hypothetical protein
MASYRLVLCSAVEGSVVAEYELEAPDHVEAIRAAESTYAREVNASPLAILVSQAGQRVHLWTYGLA